ncbi:DUF305 domain-containing protein [Kineobactrum sediminis]|uniref:DUF305 domain-containing protein n=1 Tax=Kineobactrum sediminis TaxID=1905677 RepID=A0A2N5Y629_9GAMM|nr:DUF305 domain-containing protein [Kineobactrum sediminis]PLW83843.1 DUF305 domain-containing protein [Kineobactrum sediminis]
MEKAKNQGYTRFLLMIATAIVVMYLLMYLNSYEIFGHARLSETRIFMTLIMGAAMMVIMLAFMLGMYQNTKLNLAIFIGAGLLFLSALGLVRSQITVTGVDYMEAMIPHHSIAILTSERAKIMDPRVRRLADEILLTQRKEIKEMSWLIADIKANGIAITPADVRLRAVPEFSGLPDQL